MNVVYRFPPAEDLKDIEEPVVPDLSGPDAEIRADEYDNAVLEWGRALRDAMARVRKWVEEKSK